MMTWLKRWGLAVVNMIGVVAGFGPIIKEALPGEAGQVISKGVDKLTQIASEVQTVEAIFAAVSDPNAKTGAQKLKGVTPLVAQIIQRSEILAGKKIKHEDVFIQGCTSIASGMADVLNALE